MLTLGVVIAFSSQPRVDMRWFGNMGELRKAEGEKSSCGVPSPLNELIGVCVAAVENVSFDGVETPCCRGWPDKYDDTDCLHRTCHD